MSSTTSPAVIRFVREDDFPMWRPLWDGYNAFYGRKDGTSLPSEITRVTWQRFLDPREPMFALVAEANGRLLGLTHYLFHGSTTQLAPTCYLRDLYTLDSERGRGIGKALILGVCREANIAGAQGVYWQTQATNTVARRLYDKVAENDGFIVYSRSDRT